MCTLYAAREEGLVLYMLYIPDVGSSRKRILGTLKSCTATANLLRCDSKGEGGRDGEGGRE